MGEFLVWMFFGGIVTYVSISLSEFLWKCCLSFINELVKIHASQNQASVPSSPTPANSEQSVERS